MWDSSIADDALWERLHASFTTEELVELGFFVGLTLGQQRWIKTLDIRHHEVLPGTGRGLAVDAPRDSAVLVDGGPDHGVFGPLGNPDLLARTDHNESSPRLEADQLHDR